MRVAVVHEWLLDYAGSERVLAEILRCFPQADLFALVDRMADADRAMLGGKRARTTFLQRMPGIASHLRYYVPLMPIAIEQLDLSGYDLVISSSHAVAKGVITPPDALHLSYIHSPMRWAWDLQHSTLREEGVDTGVRGVLARWLLHRLRLWDHRAASGVDGFVANSQFVARRVLKAYRREARVIYPPVDTEFFTPDGERGDFYVAVTRLIGYKRPELLLDAFRLLPDRRLVIVGYGPRLEALRAHAPRNVEFTGYLAAEQMRDLLRRARAFVFPAVEDFGIAPVEAMACGTPVIALRQGGVTETVIGIDEEAPTGAFFDEQSPEALVAAITTFEQSAARITSQACRRRAERFSAARFREEFARFVDAEYAQWRNDAGNRPGR
jgi:glycosyltransferase involved in cell wall biosynthesis